MNEDQRKEVSPLGNDLNLLTPDAKKTYETPEFFKLGDIADLTNYDVSVIV